MDKHFSFELLAQDGNARAGIIHTPHGDILTPTFAPVGTQATVKSLTPKHIDEINSQIILSNTYHLYLRPGDELIRDFGGLHDFMGWQGPILTDSGGFQVFSLASQRKIDEDGVTFRSHIDGSLHRFTPEKSIEIQNNLGADIIMAFDECADPGDSEYIEKAMERTHRWAERSKKAHSRVDQALFGIVQGGVSSDLRRKSAEFLCDLEFPGYAIGGLSVGETKEEMHQVLDLVTPILPSEKPRYLMGVGTPEDLLNGVSRGIDLFDCVLPTRLARHKSVFTLTGKLNLSNKKFAQDPNPIENACDCYTCNHFSRGYLRHLIIAKEMLASTLMSIHNLRVLISLSELMRNAILENRFNEFYNKTIIGLLRN